MCHYSLPHGFSWKISWTYLQALKHWVLWEGCSQPFLGKFICLAWKNALIVEPKKASHWTEFLLRSRSSIGAHLVESLFSWRLSTAEIENWPPQVSDTTTVRTLSWGAGLGQPENENKPDLGLSDTSTYFLALKQIEERSDPFLCSLVKASTLTLSFTSAGNSQIGARFFVFFKFTWD